MSAAKQELKKVVGEMSEEESRILLKFAEWLKDQGEELTDKELTILRRGEKQIREGGIRVVARRQKNRCLESPFQKKPSNITTG